MSSSVTNRPLNRAATIDPGWSTAVAMWSGDWVPKTTMLKLPRELTGNRASAEEKLTEMYRQFYDWVHHYENSQSIEHIIIEDVELWSEALVSLTAAERGDLFMLAKLVGGYCAIAADEDMSFELVMAKEWKGQLTKEATAKRIHRIWDSLDIDLNDCPNFSQHAYDAIGVGLWKAGVL